MRAPLLTELVGPNYPAFTILRPLGVPSFCNSVNATLFWIYLQTAATWRVQERIFSYTLMFENLCAGIRHLSVKVPAHRCFAISPQMLRVLVGTRCSSPLT